MFGDCSYCGHSVAYHLPLVGCTKCDCDEFYVRDCDSSLVSIVALLLAWRVQ